jgi:hypothetical protein
MDQSLIDGFVLNTRVLLYLHDQGAIDLDSLVDQLDSWTYECAEARALLAPYPDLVTALAKRAAKAEQTGIDFARVEFIGAVFSRPGEPDVLFKVDLFGNATATCVTADGRSLAYTGNAGLPMFATLLRASRVLAERWPGVYVDPQLAGERRTIAVFARSRLGEVRITHWTYGEKSSPPPPEVMVFTTYHSQILTELGFAE